MFSSHLPGLVPPWFLGLLTTQALTGDFSFSPLWPGAHVSSSSLPPWLHPRLLARPVTGHHGQEQALKKCFQSGCCDDKAFPSPDAAVWRTPVKASPSLSPLLLLCRSVSLRKGRITHNPVPCLGGDHPSLLGANTLSAVVRSLGGQLCLGGAG